MKYPKITVTDIFIAADKLEDEGFAICQVLRDPAVADLLSRIRGRVHTVTEKTISHPIPSTSEIHHVEIEWMQDKLIDLDVKPMVFDDDVIVGAMGVEPTTTPD